MLSKYIIKKGILFSYFWFMVACLHLLVFIQLFYDQKFSVINIFVALFITVVIVIFTVSFMGLEQRSGRFSMMQFEKRKNDE